MNCVVLKLQTCWTQSAASSPMGQRYRKRSLRHGSHARLPLGRCPPVGPKAGQPVPSGGASRPRTFIESARGLARPTCWLVAEGTRCHFLCFRNKQGFRILLSALHPFGKSSPYANRTHMVKRLVAMRPGQFRPGLQLGGLRSLTQKQKRQVVTCRLVIQIVEPQRLAAR